MEEKKGWGAAESLKNNNNKQASIAKQVGSATWKMKMKYVQVQPYASYIP
jgi:hypothetical protein